MLELLMEELENIGLAMNTAKSNIFTLDKKYCECPSSIVIDVAEAFMEDARTGDSRKYLGSLMPGGLQTRGRAALMSR